MGAALDRRHRQLAVAQQEGPATGIAQDRGNESLARAQLRQHCLRRHHLLEQLAIIRRRHLQRGLCVDFGRHVFGNFLVERCRGFLVRLHTGAPCLFEHIALPVEFAERVGNTFPPADCLTHARVAGIFRQARSGTGDLLAGDAALAELGRFEHLRQQFLAMRRILHCQRGIGCQARIDETGRSTNIQTPQGFDRTAAGSHGIRNAAAAHQHRRAQQFGIRAGTRSWDEAVERGGRLRQGTEGRIVIAFSPRDFSRGPQQASRHDRLRPTPRPHQLHRAVCRGGALGQTPLPFVDVGPIAACFDHAHQCRFGDRVGQQVLVGKLFRERTGRTAGRLGCLRRQQFGRQQTGIFGFRLIAIGQRFRQLVLIDEVQGPVMGQASLRRLIVDVR